MEDQPSPTHYEFSCGISLKSINFKVNSLPDIVGEVYVNSFEFLIVPVTNNKHLNDSSSTTKNNVSKSSFKPIILDTLLDSTFLKSVIVGKINKSILKLDSQVDSERFEQEKLFQKEVGYCGHLGLPAVLLPNPTKNSINYSKRVYSSILSAGKSTKYWLKFKINQSNIAEQWSIWNEFRSRCGSHPRLHPVLELERWNIGLNAENQKSFQEFINQWLGEPIKGILLPIKIFLKNDSGYPTLSKIHQKFIKDTFKFNLQYIVAGGDDSSSMKPYYDYLHFLYLNQDPISECDRFEQPYLDYLQSPLQPLQDNLESQTYEIFELDPVKYTNYQKAIELAIKDLLNHKEKPISKQLTIIVVGAGRGPLVQCSINACKTIQQQEERKENLPELIKIIGVEKNPNAIVTLESKKETLDDWKEFDIEIIDSDMRDWNSKQTLADILVSELLGSFGDNELSPECLDGAQKYLKKPNGISIPTWYTSYVTPVNSSVLYNAVVDLIDPNHNDKSFQTPYVVKPHIHHTLCESKPLFTFSHPNFKDEVIDNSRYGTIEFPIEINSIIHGFIGYFDCCLYSNVHISTNPKNFSTGMFSWFPIYFPIKKPIQIPKSSIIKSHFWRCVSPSKVWYEWSISSPESIEIHNILGLKSNIGL